MTRLIFCVTCVAALFLGCGEDSPGSNGGSGGGGGSDTLINGCIQSQASDMTGMANVTVTDISAWQIPHSACVRVSANTELTWQGNFTIHPLVGGETPTTDDASPITAINASSGSEDASVTLDTAGTYPYFCEIHLTTMQGVIYVE